MNLYYSFTTYFTCISIYLFIVISMHHDVSIDLQFSSEIVLYRRRVMFRLWVMFICIKLSWFLDRLISWKDERRKKKGIWLKYFFFCNKFHKLYDDAWLIKLIDKIFLLFFHCFVYILYSMNYMYILTLFIDITLHFTYKIILQKFRNINRKDCMDIFHYCK